MIDQYSYNQARSRMLREIWTDSRAVAVVIAAVLMFALQAVAIALAITHGGH